MDCVLMMDGFYSNLVIIKISGHMATAVRRSTVLVWAVCTALLML